MAMNYMDQLTCGPYLTMLIEPENKVRFRYKSEGASHGGLLGKKEGKGKKVYPTVKLHNYYGENPVYIRVSLYTDDKQPHVLEFCLPGSSEESRPYIDEYIKEDNTAEFSNLKFLSKKKEEIFQQLLDQKIKALGEKRKSLRKNYEEMYKKELKERAKNIMNSIRLCFEAFEECNSGKPIRLCEPLFSEMICNQKAASKGDLRIHRMSRVSGTWKGGDEVILLCDKVQKENIEILFYESDYTEYWEEKAIFQPVDVHYQVAITFKTPQYKLNSEKTVFVCLARNEERSEPLEFTYIPDFEENPPKKRKMLPKEPVMPFFVNESPGNSSSQYSNDSSESPGLEQPLDVESNCSSMEDLLKGFSSEMANLGTDEREVLDKICNDPLFHEIMMDEDDFVIEDESQPVIMNQSEMVVNQSFALPLIGVTQIDGPYVVPQMFQETIGVSYMKQKSVSEVTSKQYLNKKQIQQKLHSLLMRKDDSGNTLLHIAVYKNKAVKFIIKLSEFANIQLINMKNDYQETALHIATGRNNKEVVKILLKCDGNPNLKNDKGNNCYHLASQGNYFDVMSYLLLLATQKPELNAFNYEGLTPLHIAVAKNSKDCYHLLKLNSADINTLDQKSGRSLLHYAIEFQPSFITDLLKEEVINVNIQDFRGNTPLHLACSDGNVDIIKQLLKAGADPLLKNFKCKILDEASVVDDDDDVFGETPGDCTTNPEIHKILRQASVSVDYIEELCNLLDKNMKWKEVAVYVMDEKFIDSLECSMSPSKTLLHHMKKIEKDGFLEKLQNIITLTGPDEAIEIIKESHS